MSEGKERSGRMRAGIVEQNLGGSAWNRRRQLVAQLYTTTVQNCTINCTVLFAPTDGQLQQKTKCYLLFGATAFTSTSQNGWVTRKWSVPWMHA